MKNPDSYEPPQFNDWTGRVSDKKEYIYQMVNPIQVEQLDDLPQNEYFGLLGYSCDEGVRRNQGRVGAAAGPLAIKKALGRMVGNPDVHGRLLDIGNIHCENSQLEQTQDILATIVTELMHRNVFPILLGGGHDIVWGHYRGLKNILPKDTKWGIINIDAHFDLRPPTPQGNSGTPFHQIALNEKSLGNSINYLCLGINPASNAQSLFNYAVEFGVQYLLLEQMNQQELVVETIHQFSSSLDALYLTIDMDSLYAAYAPGVSAPASIGLEPFQVINIIKTIVDTQKLISTDIAELNPTYDIDGRTAKLAAHFIYTLLQHLNRSTRIMH